jgi:hypothetical protein
VLCDRKRDLGVLRDHIARTARSRSARRSRLGADD